VLISQQPPVAVTLWIFKQSARILQDAGALLEKGFNFSRSSG